MKSEPSHKTDKSAWRKTLRRARSDLGEKERSEFNRIINQNLLTRTSAQTPGSLAAFIAFDGEPDLACAMERLHQAGWRITLPKIVERAAKAEIEFHPWSPGCAMKPNRYGIPEPSGTSMVPPQELDIVLVPLVGWDCEGRRLGMGASFYDRFLQPWASLDRPRRIGVAYDVQQARELPDDPWDVALHELISESGIHTFNPGDTR